MAKHKKRRLTSDRTRNDRTQPHVNRSAGQQATTKKKEIKPTIPFDAEQRILLVGEGDFSFARAIIDHHGCCDVTATCLDAKSDLFAKYPPQAEQNVSYIEQEGQTVLFEVNATTLDKPKTLRTGERFERIIFNFPHVGGKSTDVNRQVRFNQELLFKFFQSAVDLLASDGAIVITLFEGEPYTLWNIRDLARSSNLLVDTSFAFRADAYPGYKHARTLGNIEGGGGWKGEGRDARSYVFKAKPQTTLAPRQSDAVPSQTKKRKKKSQEGDSDED